MQRNVLKADGLLLLTALIWGAAFVAQRVGMEHVGPLTFNGLRFALGAASLLPLALRHSAATSGQLTGLKALGGGVLAGCILFSGASLQQFGLVETTAGNAGFITGLYVVIVPLIGRFLGQKPGLGSWVGAVLSAVGLYLLSVTADLRFNPGDLLVFIGAFFWAGHVLVIGWLSPHMNAARLSCLQFAVCSALSLLAACATEEIAWAGIMDAAIPILYGGFMSVGVAFTLQVVAQQDSPPAHAAIIMSLESVFAALTGWLLLGETLSHRGLVGCALMLVGMLCAQLWPERRTRTA